MSRLPLAELSPAVRASLAGLMEQQPRHPLELADAVLVPAPEQRADLVVRLAVGFRVRGGPNRLGCETIPSR